ncbi:hypothetical protein [Streptomyces sp. NPDC058701]|uniref:hypothetical protein n=1 Tax=Streptomyces sp. NPDC058701 TaxID=3346608 RepID=UPI0036667CFE
MPVRVDLTAEIAVVGDELRIDNALGVNLYGAPPEFVTALRPTTFGVGPFHPTPGRVVITAESTRRTCSTCGCGARPTRSG